MLPKATRAGVLDGEERRRLEGLQLVFQSLTRRLLDFVEQDPKLSAEVMPASKHFFHGRNPLPHVRDEIDGQLAFGRFAEWFNYERVSRSYREQPITTFVDAAARRATLRRTAEAQRA